MKKYTYHFEIRTLVAQFIDAMNEVVIKRYNNNNQPQDQIQVNFLYSPKNRVLHDLVNKAAHIKLPVISVSIAGIKRAENRVFNKIEGPYYSLSRNTSGYEHLLQPVPVDVTMNMSIVTRFQHDLDQILTNFIPYTDPYVVVSWHMPITNLEIRSHVIWNGNVSITQPNDISHTEFYRNVADTSFTIEGWLFKAPEDPVGKIYKIDTSFTAVSDIMSNLDLMKSYESIYNTDTFIISARPQVTLCEPFLTIPCVNDKHFSIQGKMFDYVTQIYASGSPGVFTTQPSGITGGNYFTYYNPASGNRRISAQYPGFSAIKITDWHRHSDNLITFTLPSAVSAGYIDIIAFNEAGYGRLMSDAIRPTLNPYPTSTPEFSAYHEYQHPSISGINVAPFYYSCPWINN